jgi:hypothetical protein
LPALLLLQKRQPLCNQGTPGSFSETPGVGGVAHFAHGACGHKSRALLFPHYLQTRASPGQSVASASFDQAPISAEP